MENYIVRIYRRDEKDLNSLVGLVEIVGLDEKKPFRNAAELLEILKSAETNLQSDGQ